MKLNYYGYYFHEVATERKIQTPVKPLLSSFCEFNNPEFRNSFVHNDERTYLIEIGNDTFIFLKSKDTEIVKTINWEQMSIDELSSRLEQNESVAFASYVVIKDSYLAFAATQLAPTISAFSSFVNDLLTKTNCLDHQFRIVAFTEQLSRNDAMKMDFIGTTSIQVNADSVLFNRVAEVFGAEPDILHDLGTFEIVLKPKRRKNIKEISTKLIHTEAVGVEKLTIRAKNELNDKLTDFRIEGLGIVHDIIEKDGKQSIQDAILEKIRENDNLASKVQDHEQDEEFTRERIVAIDQLNSADNWHNALGRIQGKREGSVN